MNRSESWWGRAYNAHPAAFMGEFQALLGPQGQYFVITSAVGGFLLAFNRPEILSQMMLALITPATVLIVAVITVLVGFRRELKECITREGNDPNNPVELETLSTFLHSSVIAIVFASTFVILAKYLNADQDYVLALFGLIATFFYAIVLVGFAPVGRLAVDLILEKETTLHSKKLALVASPFYGVGFVRRVWIRCCDFVLSTGVGVLLYSFGLVQGLNVGWPDWRTFLIYSACLGVFYDYICLNIGISGVAKRKLGVRIVNIRTSPDSPIGRPLLRSLILYVPLVLIAWSLCYMRQEVGDVLFGVGLGIAFLNTGVFDPQQQGIHDKVARTRLVESTK